MYFIRLFISSFWHTVFLQISNILQVSKQPDSTDYNLLQTDQNFHIQHQWGKGCSFSYSRYFSSCCVNSPVSSMWFPVLLRIPTVTRLGHQGWLWWLSRTGWFSSGLWVFSIRSLGSLNWVSGFSLSGLWVLSTNTDGTCSLAMMDADNARCVYCMRHYASSVCKLAHQTKPLCFQNFKIITSGI